MMSRMCVTCRSGFGVTLNKKGLKRPYMRSPAEVRALFNTDCYSIGCQQVQKQYEANVTAKQISTKAKMPF